MTKIRLNASEREIIRPFIVDDSILDDCAIEYSKQIGFDKSPTIILDDIEVDTLKLRISLPLDDICSVFTAEADELILSVIVRDQSQRSYVVIYEHSLSETTETPELLDRLPSNLSIGKLSISVLLTRKPNKSDLSTFHKLAQKEFKFSGSNQRIDFPRVWKTADEFRAAGLPSTALWHLSWIGEDLDKALNELVVLWLNDNYKTQLQIIGASSEEQAFQRLWASSVLADLAHTVLRRGILEDVTQSIAFQTVDSQFIGRFYTDHEQLSSLIKRSDFGSMVSAWTQDIISVAEIVEDKRA